MKKNCTMDMLSTLALFLVFLLLAVGMLVGGLRVYRTTEQRMTDTFATQTPLSYLAAKTRQNGQARIVTLDGGMQALALDAVYDGETYTTFLYCYGGQLCELFTPQDVSLTPDQGVPLLEAGALSFCAADNLIQVDYTAPDGQTAQLLLAPSFAREEAAA